MKTLKSILVIYTEKLRALLIPLGPWGVFLIAAADSSFLGIPIDPLIAFFVYRQPSRFWIYAAAGAAGSALGSLVVYYIGKKGEELLLERRIPKHRLERMKKSFEEHEALALVVPSMLPPPTPFKLFVLFAGAAHISVRDFLLAIFFGRVMRFSILSVLVVTFGPDIVELTAQLIRKHGWLVLAILAIAGLGAYLFYRQRKKKTLLC